jgi:hypothetical protein
LRLCELGVILLLRSAQVLPSTADSRCLPSLQKLSDDGSLEVLVKAVDSGATSYFASQLGIPGLRHFVYKSRPHVQITLTAFEEPYDTLDSQRR